MNVGEIALISSAVSFIVGTLVGARQGYIKGELNGSRRGFKRADAAFAKNHVVIAARQNVFGAHQPFFNRHREAALQNHRRLRLPHFFQQIKVL